MSLTEEQAIELRIDEIDFYLKMIAASHITKFLSLGENGDDFDMLKAAAKEVHDFHYARLKALMTPPSL